MIRHASALAAAICLTACEQKPLPLQDVPDVPAVVVPEVQSPVPTFEPPAARTPLLKQFLDKEVAQRAPVGTYVDAELAEPIPLKAVGLNQCQNGYTLQGYMQRGDAIVATPPLPIRYATLPTAPAESHHPAIAGQALQLDLKTATLRTLTGSVAIVSTADQKTLMKMQIDAATPIGILTGRGLGAQGCFTTGRYELKTASGTTDGPVAAVFDGKRLYYVGARLTEKYGIGLWFHLEPAHRQPENVLRGDLATIADNPRKFPFRVVFETRKSTPDGVSIEETPATAGRVMASWSTTQAEGPLRIEVSDLIFPKWEGPLSGSEIQRLRIAASFVTDLQGSRVPLPPRDLPE